MKRIEFAYLLLILLSACGGKDKNALSLSGEIKGLGDDTLYIYGMDKMRDRMDTVPVKNHKFSATLTTDTLVGTWLLFSDGTEYPLFLDKGNRIEIKGDTATLASLQITGNTPNEELTAFLKETAGTSEKALQEKAEAFIESHPFSLASAYLLEKYFVQIPQPDINRIKRLTERMTGVLKDRPRIAELLDRFREEEKADIGKMMPHFQLPNAKGTKIGRNNFKDKYLLLHFWASWNPESMEANTALRTIYREEKKNKYNKFALWGISLDTNREEWEGIIRRDSLEWEQSCDFSGWNSEAVRQLVIRTLPANLLLNPSGRIEGRDLSEAEIRAKIEKATQEEKEKQEAERKKKKKN